MMTKRERPSEGDGRLDFRLGSGKSSTNYTLFCRVCGIPTLDPLCPTCQAWCDVGSHIQSAARAMKSMRPKPIHPKEEGRKS
jgi:hypothetical protein